VAGDQHPAVADSRGQAADPAGHDWRAARLRLDGDQAEGLRVTGHDHHVGRPVQIRQEVAGDGIHEVHDVLQAEVRDEFGQFLRPSRCPNRRGRR
jgi:hypothetical protein